MWKQGLLIGLFFRIAFICLTFLYPFCWKPYRCTIGSMFQWPGQPRAKPPSTTQPVTTSLQSLAPGKLGHECNGRIDEDIRGKKVWLLIAGNWLPAAGNLRWRHKIKKRRENAKSQRKISPKRKVSFFGKPETALFVLSPIDPQEKVFLSHVSFSPVQGCLYLLRYIIHLMIQYIHQMI